MTETLTKNEQLALDELVWEYSSPHPIRAIAVRIGMSHGRVEQIEKIALRKLRRAAERSAKGRDFRGDR